MITLNQLRSQVRSMADLDEADLPNAVIDQFAREGFQRIYTLERRWPYLQKTFTLTTVAGTRSYTIENIGDIREIISVVDTSTSGSRMTLIAYDDAEEIWLGNTDVPSRPYFFSIWEDKMHFWPKPDNAYPIKVQENLKIFIQKKYDGVMAAQVVAAAAPGAVRTMKDAKIPMVATFVVHPGVPFVDVNNGAAGAMAGAGLMKEALRKWGKNVEPYLLIGSLKEGGLNSIQRMDGYYVGVNQVQPNFPSSRFIDVPTQGADPAKTNVNTGNALQTIPKDAKIILGGINDDNTVAMVQAYKASGRNMNNLLAVGQGASLLSNICSGELYGSVAYFPENYGKYLIPAVMGLINKQSVPKHVVLPTTLLTAKNVGKFYPKSAC